MLKRRLARREVFAKMAEENKTKEVVEEKVEQVLEAVEVVATVEVVVEKKEEKKEAIIFKKKARRAPRVQAEE